MKWLALLPLLGCHKPKPNEPLRVELGDCASVTTEFESGPRPGVARVNDLRSAIVRASVERVLGKLVECYDAQQPALAVTATAELALEPNGTISNIAVTGVAPAFATCIADAVRAVTIPLHAASRVTVRFPFAFAPARVRASSQDAAPPADGGHTRVKNTVGSPDAVGADDVLRERIGAISNCLDEQDQAYGAIVVELGANVRVLGALDASAKECIANATTGLSPDKPQRCGFAFAHGEMPATDRPTVEIDASGVTWNGEVVATIDAATRDGGLDALATALSKWAAQRDPEVPVVGPGTLRVGDRVPMALVYRVLTVAAIARVPLVLASQRGPLRVVDGPVAPVPVGTGGSWNVGASALAPRDYERVELSALLQPDRMTIGLSRVDQFFSITKVGDDHDWQRILTTLKEQKASAFFAERNDLELAADAAVPFGDLVRAIDVAVRAGFADWSIVTEQELSASPSR